MDTVRLKNGSEEPNALVAVTMVSLDALLDGHPIAAYDLVMMCRDSNYKPFGGNGKTLRDRALIDESGRVHDSIKNIVLSAAKGDGMSMTFGSPVAITSASA